MHAFELRRCLVPLLTILLGLPAGTTGLLRLQSQPGVEISWEGVALGETDAEGLLVIEGVPPGEHRLTLRKSGFHDLDTRIKVVEGADLSQELLLKPVSGPVNRGPVGQPSHDPSAGGETGPKEQARRPAGESTGHRSPLAGTTEAMAGPLAVKSGATPIAPSVLIGIAFLTALLAGVAGAKLLSNRRKASKRSRRPSRRAARSRSGGDEMPVFEEADPGSPGFLEDLKRRERQFEDVPEQQPPAPKETIIEVEAVEVRPAARWPADKAG